MSDAKMWRRDGKGGRDVAARGLVSHIDLNVSDPARSLPFYRLVLEYLGLEPTDVAEDHGIWEQRLSGGVRWGVEVRAPREAAPRDRHERYAPGIDHLAFHAASRADVDGLHALLVEAGYPVADPPAEYDYTPGYYAVAFDDPDGVRLEVVYEPRANP